MEGSLAFSCDRACCCGQARQASQIVVDTEISATSGMEDLLNLPCRNPLHFSQHSDRRGCSAKLQSRQVNLYSGCAENYCMSPCCRTTLDRKLCLGACYQGQRRMSSMCRTVRQSPIYLSAREQTPLKTKVGLLSPLSAPRQHARRSDAS